MGELSRWEDLLKTGSEDTVKPLSRVEAILRDEDITPQSRIEKLLIEGGGGGGAVLYDEYEITQNKTKIVPPVGYDGFSSVITNVPDPFTKVELYQVEYDALTQEEKLDPSKFYVIKPGSPRVYLYKWDFTKSLVDEVQGVEVTNLKNGAYRDNNGLNFTLVNSNAILNIVFDINNIYEFEFGNINKSFSNQHGRFIMCNNYYGFVWRNDGQGYWGVYQGDWYLDQSESQYNNNSNIFNNAILKIKWEDLVPYSTFYKGKLCIYSNDRLVFKSAELYPPLLHNKQIQLSSSDGQSFYTYTIKSLKVYKNEEV